MNWNFCVQIFDTYKEFLAVGMYAALVLFGFVNCVYNLYGKQNKRFCRAIVNLLENKGDFVGALPKEYQRQWRAFVNGNADKPSRVMEFVDLPKVWVCKWLFIVTFVLELAFGIYAFAYGSSMSLYVFVGYLFACVAGAFLIALVQKNNRLYAKRLFSKFVSLANANTQARVPCTPVKHAMEQIQMLAKDLPCEQNLQQAAEILRGCGLECPRSVEDQRKLNFAVNGLLQSYARKIKSA